MCGNLADAVCTCQTVTFSAASPSSAIGRDTATPPPKSVMVSSPMRTDNTVIDASRHIPLTRQLSRFERCRRPARRCPAPRYHQLHRLALHGQRLVRRYEPRDIRRVRLPPLFISVTGAGGGAGGSYGGCFKTATRVRFDAAVKV